MATHQDVYTGFWTNHAHGSIIGATLTLSGRDGAYLIAFLALFVHMVGACLWRLICYGIFQFRAHPNLQSSVQLQEQVVLCNSMSAVSGMRNLMLLIVRSRRGVPGSTSLLLFAATINLTAFFAAGILSSKVTTTRPDVLLSPTNCGRWWAYVNVCRSDNGAAYDEHRKGFDRARASTSNLRYTSSQYAESCYESIVPSSECTSFSRRLPTWTKSLRAECPFGDNVCDGNVTLHLDSGYIDSILDLGINTPEQDRLSLRLVKECAPLLRDEYLKTYDGTNVSEPMGEDIGGSNKAMASMFGSGWESFSYEALNYGQNQLIGYKQYENTTYLWSNETLQGSIVGTQPMGKFETLFL